jgi:hypothetical protein
MPNTVDRSFILFTLILGLGACYYPPVPEDGGDGYILSSEGTFRLKRLNGGEPLVHIDGNAEYGITDRSEIDNIQGPSVVRLPEWLPDHRKVDPDAVYYMYFAHHHGRFIRMAWAEKIEGPWTLYNVKGRAIGDRGVLDIGDHDVPIGNGLAIAGSRRPHIASPEVAIDDANRRFVLFFHVGRVTLDATMLEGQIGLVATSADGLNFNSVNNPGHGIAPVVIGPRYAHPFRYNGKQYAIAGLGAIFQAPNLEAPFSPPDGWDFAKPLWRQVPALDLHRAVMQHVDPSTRLRMRHCDIVERKEGERDVLWLFYTLKGRYEVDGEIAPEQVLFSKLYPNPENSNYWDLSWPPERVLWARRGWECGGSAPVVAKGSQAPEAANQLRDPNVFEDADGRMYLFYTGCGEDGIGVAAIELAEPMRGDLSRGR